MGEGPPPAANSSCDSRHRDWISEPPGVPRAPLEGQDCVWLALWPNTPQK